MSVGVILNEKIILFDFLHLNALSLKPTVFYLGYVYLCRVSQKASCHHHENHHGTHVCSKRLYSVLKILGGYSKW